MSVCKQKPNIKYQKINMRAFYSNLFKDYLSQPSVSQLTVAQMQSNFGRPRSFRHETLGVLTTTENLVWPCSNCWVNYKITCKAQLITRLSTSALQGYQFIDSSLLITYVPQHSKQLTQDSCCISGKCYFVAYNSLAHHDFWQILSTFVHLLKTQQKPCGSCNYA